MNTEIGIIVDSAELARQLRAFMEAGVGSANAWKLTLDPRDGDLRWNATDDGHAVVHDTEPDAGRWRRFTAWLIKVLPVEREL